MRPFDALRKGDAAVKESGITVETPDDDVIALMVKFPNTLQRPIVEVGERAVLARPIERALELLKK
ncbi:MAG TPA: ArsC/Spx/MgsR family protein [Pyrinomonadaceae bacterium]|nr:hypothetical protein [Chloracidobacterium sp.]MBP9936313.1 hypothetical protein [Pyrinomonadaceae bacterium]MBK7802949.1 hypothetical protein [Chloracidobacterium sp.]MBK9438399.1 hypothetical protein [Chloracidobacterium sp.]MBK9767914.1 hypothetical protein [Chloracidobacterium sp.]